MSELQQVGIDVTTSRVEEFIREWEAVNRPVEFTLWLGRITRVVVLAQSRGEAEELLSVWREVCHGRARVVGTKDEEAKRQHRILRQRADLPAATVRMSAEAG